MRQGIHPTYNKIEATCVCGNTVSTGSVAAEMKLDICSACHPFFTGQQKIMDTEGRVERFKKRFDKKEDMSAASLSAKKAKKAKAQEEERIRRENEQKEREEAIKLANKPKRDPAAELAKKKLASETSSQRGLDSTEAKPEDAAKTEGDAVPAEAAAKPEGEAAAAEQKVETVAENTEAQQPAPDADAAAQEADKIAQG